jgi:hypothetical protein
MSSPAKISASRQNRLPYLNELGFSLATNLVIVTAIAVAIISLISGGSILATALRTGVAVLVVGLLGWMINWVLVGGGSTPAKDKPELSHEPEKTPAHTIEKSA